MGHIGDPVTCAHRRWRKKRREDLRFVRSSGLETPYSYNWASQAIGLSEEAKNGTVK